MSCLTYLESTFSLLGYLGVDIFVNKTSTCTVMSADLRPKPGEAHMAVAHLFARQTYRGFGHSGDDEDDDPCLSEALLQVSDTFDPLGCLCDANSFM